MCPVCKSRKRRSCIDDAIDNSIGGFFFSTTSIYISPKKLHNSNFDPEYKLVASGWSKLADKSQLYFSVLDFKAGQEIFQKMGMNSAPSVLYFPATASQSTQDRYDFGKL